MTFERFMVISWSEEEERLFVDHFPSLKEAKTHAKRLQELGITAQVTEQREMYKFPPEKPEETDDHGGVMPGEDFPPTMGPSVDLGNWRQAV